MIVYDEKTKEVIAVLTENEVVLKKGYNITKSDVLIGKDNKLYISLKAEIIDFDKYKGRYK